MGEKVKVSVIYYSKTGNTEKMAKAVVKGCKIDNDIEVRIFEVGKVDLKYLAQSSVVLFGSPVYNQNMAWPMKKCLDDEVYGRLHGKFGGAFVTQGSPAGGGGSIACQSILMALLNRGMILYNGGHISCHIPHLHTGAVMNNAQEKEGLEYGYMLGKTVVTKAKEMVKGP